MNNVLVLRTCAADLTSYNGFQWPRSGHVACPDWNPEPICGGGLHGLLWGEGDGHLLDWDETASWLVVQVRADHIVPIGNDKVKFPEGEVVFCGDRGVAIDFLAVRAPAGKIIVGGTATAGDGGTATAGYRGTATAGDRGTATAGDGGTATAGDRGTATAGDGGTLVIAFWNSDSQRYRLAVGYVGEQGILANKPYHVKDGQLTLVEEHQE